MMDINGLIVWNYACHDDMFTFEWYTMGGGNWVWEMHKWKPKNKKERRWNGTQVVARHIKWNLFDGIQVNPLQ